MRRDDPLIEALTRVTFVPGTFAKRWVNQLRARRPDYILSDKGEAFAWRLGFTFRRQLPRDLAAQAIARKVDHRPAPLTSADSPYLGGLTGQFRCVTCGERLDKRELNTPCRGPQKQTLTHTD